MLQSFQQVKLSKVCTSLKEYFTFKFKMFLFTHPHVIQDLYVFLQSNKVTYKVDVFLDSTFSISFSKSDFICVLRHFKCSFYKVNIT